MRRAASAAVVSSMDEPPRAGSASPTGLREARAGVLAPTARPTLSINGSTDRGRGAPALLVGRGFYTPDVVRPQKVDEGQSPLGFALEGGDVPRDERPLEELNLLPLKLGKNPTSSMKSRLTSRPSVGSITRLQLSGMDEAMESLHRANSAGMGPTRRIEMPQDLHHHGPAPLVGRGWHTPDAMHAARPDTSPGAFSLDAGSPQLAGSTLGRTSSADHRPVVGGLPPVSGLPPLGKRGSRENLRDSPSSDAESRVTLAGPPIVEEMDPSEMGAAAVAVAGAPSWSADADGAKPKMGQFDGMKRNAASMAALSSMLTGGSASDGEESVQDTPQAEPQPEPEQELGGRVASMLSQQSMASMASAGSAISATDSGEFALGSDEDSPNKNHMKTNMTRRTSSGTDIHYISFWEGHGGGHLIREDSYQFAGARRQQQIKPEHRGGYAKGE